MKPIICLLMSCWSLLGEAQPPVLTITADKTTSLVFPFPVQHVDRGSREVLVQQVRDAGHILLVKAAGSQLGETSLCVVTGDGGLYTFLVRYAAHPDSLVYEVAPGKPRGLAAQAAMVAARQRTFFSVRSHSWDIEARLTGLYSDGAALYFQVEVENNGLLPYGQDFIRFYIRDRRGLRRSAVQEIEQLPLLLHGGPARVGGQQKRVVVAVLPLFTLPDGRYLSIDMGEAGGGRNLELRLGQRGLLRARPLHP